MSLLFDALKRARGNEARASSDTAIVEKPKMQSTVMLSRLLPYLVAGLILLAAVWFTYQKTQSRPLLTTKLPEPQLAAASAVPPVATSGIPQINSLSATAAGSNSQHDLTHPVKAKKHHVKNRQKYKQPVLPAGSDPLKEGYRALVSGNLALAEQKYLEALVLHPHEKDALLGLAIVAQRKLQTDRAISLYRQVLREDIGNTAAAAGLVSLSAMADPLAAESQLKELIELKPASAEFHYAIGNVLAQQLRWGEAQQAFFHAYTLSPDNALYAYNLAVALDRLHQSDAALSYYRKAESLANDPTLDMQAIDKRIEELNLSH